MIKSVKQFWDVPKNVSDTFKHLSQGNVVKATESYFKSVPGVMVLSKGSVAALNYAASAFNTTAQGVASKSALNATSKAIEAATKWYLTPAKAAGSKVSFAVKNASATAMKGTALAAALLTADSLIARWSKGTSTINTVRGLWDERVRKQELAKSKNKRNFAQGVGDFVTAGFARRGYLKIYDILVGKFKEARK